MIIRRSKERRRRRRKISKIERKRLKTPPRRGGPFDF